MNIWPLLYAAAAALVPLGLVSGLYRSAKFRTADGVTVQLSALSIASYVAWLGLSSGVSAGVYATLVATIVLVAAQFVLVVTFTGVSRWWLFAGFLVAVGAFALGSLFAVLGTIAVLAIDWTWWVRAIRDIVRSSSAHAVSVWGWVAMILADAAWIAESIRTEQWLLVIQCAALGAAPVAAGVLTVRAHRRPHLGRIEPVPAQDAVLAA